MYRIAGITNMSFKNKIKRLFLRKQLSQLIEKGDILKKQANQKTLALIVPELRPSLFKDISEKLVVVKVPSQTLSSLTNSLIWMTGEINYNNLPRKDFFSWSKIEHRALDQFITLNNEGCYTDPVKEVAAFREALMKFLEAIKFSDGEETGIPGRYNYVCKPFITILTGLTIDMVVASIV